MKEKKDCKIVQDLLPNYIEDLTNEETNYFIDEHINECPECQKILENMQKEIKLNTKKRDDREVKYIKKYSKRIKLLRNILLIIVVLFVIFVGRKTFILTNLKLENYNEGQIRITEAYYKEEKSLITITSYSKEAGEMKQILYKSGEERFSLIDNGENKVYKKMGDILVRPIAFTSDFFLENLFTAITTNIDKVKLNGKPCYLIKDGNTEKFIDINTGLAIKMIDNQNNRTVDYEYEFGIVKDSDIVKPDTTGYIENE